MAPDLETFRKTVATICDPLPGAAFEGEAQGAIPSWKIGGKMFACVAHSFDGVAVKCRDVETASMLIDAGVAEKAAYFHKSWVRLGPETGAEELQHRIAHSYDVIRASLPKKVQAALPPREAT